jgi:hypothetical protein
MVRPEVLRYLRDNLKKFPTDALRHQLALDGVSDQEFDAAVKELRKTQPTKIKARASGALGRALMFLGALGVVGAAALAVFQKPKVPSAEGPRSAPIEAGFVGHAGYVIKLPSGYAAVPRFKDESKTVELVHFCKAGTDPTNFLDEGLFGQLGIVRLEARPSPVPTDLSGLERLTSLITGQAQQRGEKFTVKSLHISTLRGVQLTYEVPFPRVEAYILGQQILYIFTAGQDDETYRSLVQSLRDARSEI